MRQAQVIGQMQVTFTSPSVEPLLWVPDIVAFAQSHLERGSDAGYAVPLAPLLRVVPVEQPPVAEARDRGPPELSSLGWNGSGLHSLV